MAHLFGPVPSRRLGRSLGVDLIPPKTCPYNCIYCEVGPTTRQTRRRFAFQPEAILRELADYLKDSGVTPDVITLASATQPTTGPPMLMPTRTLGPPKKATRAGA